MTPSIESTLGNSVWVHENTDKLKQALPQDWSDPTEAFGLPFRYKIKLAGVDYKTDAELACVIELLHHSGLLLQQGNKWKVNSEWSYVDFSHNLMRNPFVLTIH